MRLLVDGVDVAEVATTSTALQKMKGLLGRSSVDGAMYFPDVPSVHTFFMRFAIDVAFLDANNVVRHVLTMKPWRISGKHNGIKHVLEARAGAFATWRLAPGSTVALVESGSGR
jgi:uncharacterized membrane protein (UPF0127 family)